MSFFELLNNNNFSNSNLILETIYNGRSNFNSNPHHLHLLFHSNYFFYSLSSSIIIRLIEDHSCMLFSTISFTLLSYSPLFYWYNWAAWLFAGDIGLGSQSNDLMEVKTAHTSYTGLHWFIKTTFKNILLSRQMRPSLYMFGWNI